MARTHVWWNTKGPKSTPKQELTTGSVRIKQVRSGIGHSWRMRQTLEAMGLRHHQAEVIHKDSPALRGQIKRVRHLVVVTNVDDEAQNGTEAQIADKRKKKDESK